MSRMLIPAAMVMLGATLVANTASAMGFLDTTDYNKNSPGGSTPASVPELAIGAAGGALIVLVGGAAVWAGRRRRSSKP